MLKAKKSVDVCVCVCIYVHMSMSMRGGGVKYKLSPSALSTFISLL